ncbi:MAG: Arm DNA-binding domain-containing protein [Cyanobacteria bacterium P01_A01_bin.17]
MRRFFSRKDNGKSQISFGVYPDVSLKEARNQRDKARKLIASGIE